MKTLALCFVAVLVGCAYAEAPSSGYQYSRPSGGGGHGGYSGGGGHGGGGHGGGGFVSGGGFSSGEGFNVDANVLEQVRQILLKNEGSSGGHSSYYRGGHGAYDISLGDIRQAIQVAQFSQSHTVPVASYPSSGYGVPSGSYGVPSSSYGAPSRPSSSYGAPF